MPSDALIAGYVIFAIAVVLIIVGVIILSCWVYRRRKRTKQENNLVYHSGNSVVIGNGPASTHAHVNHVVPAMDHVDHNSNTQTQKQYTVLNTSMASSMDRTGRKQKAVKTKQHNSQTLPGVHKAYSDVYVLNNSRGRTLSNGQASARSERSMPPSSPGVYKVHTMQQGQSGKTFLMLEPTAAGVTSLSRTEAQKREVHNWVRSHPNTNHRAMSEEILMAGMDDKREHGGQEQRRHFSDGTDGPLKIEGRINTDQYARPREIALSGEAIDHSGRRVAVEPSKNVEPVLNCTPDPDNSGNEKTYVRWSPRMRKKTDQDIYIPSPEPELTSQSSYVIASGTLTMPHRSEAGRRPSPIHSKPVGTLPAL